MQSVVCRSIIGRTFCCGLDRAACVCDNVVGLNMAIEKKEDTSIRLRKRKYEERHKEERQKATKVFSTLIKTEQLAEINAFLAKHHITKVDLVFAG